MYLREKIKFMLFKVGVLLAILFLIRWHKAFFVPASSFRQKQQVPFHNVFLEMERRGLVPLLLAEDYGDAPSMNRTGRKIYHVFFYLLHLPLIPPKYIYSCANLLYMFLKPDFKNMPKQVRNFPKLSVSLGFCACCYDLFQKPYIFACVCECVNLYFQQSAHTHTKNH